MIATKDINTVILADIPSTNRSVILVHIHNHIHPYYLREYITIVCRAGLTKSLLYVNKTFAALNL